MSGWMLRLTERRPTSRLWAPQRHDDRQTRGRALLVALLAGVPVRVDPHLRHPLDLHRGSDGVRSGCRGRGVEIQCVGWRCGAGHCSGREVVSARLTEQRICGVGQRAVRAGPGGRGSCLWGSGSRPAGSRGGSRIWGRGRHNRRTARVAVVRGLRCMAVRAGVDAHRLVLTSSLEWSSSTRCPAPSRPACRHSGAVERSRRWGRRCPRPSSAWLSPLRCPSLLPAAPPRPSFAVAVASSPMALAASPS